MRALSIAVLLLMGCATTTAAGVKREAEARLEGCLGAEIIVDQETRDGCVSDAMLYCNGTSFGFLCTRQELIQHTQVMYVRRPDAGAKP
jgi:hypothetical protein